MVLESPGSPLEPRDLPVPQPGPGQLLLEVSVCAVCRTDLHVVDGELPDPKLPLVPGHQIVGRVAALGEGAGRHAIGDRVGVPWLGYAEYAVAREDFCFAIPEGYPDLQAAPLLCAGLIGYRSLRLAGDAERLGLYGFGAAAHIVAQVAAHQGRRVFAFTRDGDVEAQDFARELGAEWAGGSNERPPEELDAAILFAPAGELVPTALAVVAKGGTVVCAGIHMTDIPSFPYELLWGERQVRSVANLTRVDGDEFLALAPRVPVRTEIETFPLEEANEALDHLRAGRIRGAAVLVV